MDWCKSFRWCHGSGMKAPAQPNCPAESVLLDFLNSAFLRVKYSISLLSITNDLLVQNLNLNDVLMIHQIDNHSPGAVTLGVGMGLVPSSHARCETQSSGISAEEIREVIPVPDGLRKEATFICFYTNRGYRNAMECWSLQRLFLGQGYLWVFWRYLSDLCIVIEGSNMIFHSLTFVMSWGKCWKPRA